MSSMKFEIKEENSGSKDEVLNSLRDYLFTLGYKAKKKNDGFILTRGSLLGSMTSITPRRWKTIVKIFSKEAFKYQVQYDINTTGQMITEPEKSFWKKEKENVSRVLSGGDPVSIELVESEVSSLAKKVILRIVVFSTIGALIGAILVVVGRLIGNEIRAGTLPGIGAGIGACYGMMKALKGK